MIKILLTEKESFKMKNLYVQYAVMFMKEKLLQQNVHSAM